MSIASDHLKEIAGATPATTAAENQPATPPIETPETPGEAVVTDPATPPVKTEAEIASQLEAAKNTPPATPEGNEPATPPATEPPATPGTDIDEEAIARKFLKSKGLEFEKFEDLKPAQAAKTDDEIKADKEAERAQIIEFGLKNKLIKTDDLDAYGRDKGRSNQEIAFEVFSNAQRAADANVTDEQLEQRFNDRFGLEEEDGHWKKVDGLRDMEYVAQQHINNKHAGLNSVENIYRAQVQEENDAREYNKAVEEVFNTLPGEFEITIGGKPYKYKLFPDSIAAVKEAITNRAQFDAFGKKVPEGGLLKETILSSLKMKDFDKIVKEIADSHASAVLLENQAGRIGALPTRENGSQQDALPAGTAASHAREIQKQAQKN